MIADDEVDYLYKIVLAGEAGVGKTFLLSQYIKGKLPHNQNSTIGVEYATRSVPLQSGGTVRAQIWDTAGQERYKSITTAHFRRAAGALLVFDITNEKSFLGAQRWLEELKEHAEPDIVIMLVGNKIDLVEKKPSLRRVDFEKVKSFSKAQGMLYQETSAVTRSGVKEAFENLLQEVYNLKSRTGRQTTSDSMGKVLIPKLHPRQKSTCCN